MEDRCQHGDETSFPIRRGQLMCSPLHAVVGHLLAVGQCNVEAEDHVKGGGLP